MKILTCNNMDEATTQDVVANLALGVVLSVAICAATEVWFRRQQRKLEED